MTSAEVPARSAPVDSVTAAQADAEERADLDEDRRRQRELDEAELGGEA